MKKMLACILLAVLLLCFAGCARENQQEHLQLVVTADSISQLEDYPNLKSVDLSGSTCYEAIAAYMAAHPEVQVSYTVALGGATVNSTMENLVLPHGSFDYETLKTNLQYLPGLQSLKLSATELTAEQVAQLKAAYPAVSIECSVKLQGVELSDATQVDLSWLTADQVAATAQKLQLLSGLTEASLPASLTLADVQLLQEALPNVTFQYSFQLFDKTVSTADTALEFTKLTLDTEKEQTLRAALAVLNKLTSLKLTECTLGDGMLSALQADFPAVTIEHTQPSSSSNSSSSNSSNSSSNSSSSSSSSSGPTYTPADGKEKVELTVSASTLLTEIAKYPQLKEVTFKGTCYAEMLSYMNANPRVHVNYTVSLGGSSTAVSNATTTLSLASGAYDYATLKANLKYLPKVTAVTFPSTSLTADQLKDLKTAYPKVAFHYTMTVQDTALSATATTADLSAMTSAQVDSYIAQLQGYPNILYVELMNASGKSNLSVADVKKLQDGCPGITFHYSFTLGGKTVSTTDERIELVGVTLNGIGEQNLRNALDILDSCTYFLLNNIANSKVDSSGDLPIDNEVMASIRDAYPHIKIVWRIYHDAINTYDFNLKKVWHDSLLTDTEVLRAVYGVNDSNSDVFKYLTDVRFVDLGHNTSMRSLSFLGYMPNLELVILSGSEISDLSPLANCKKLEFLELGWCGWVKDITPLAQCTGLRYLNLSYTSVKDLSPLDNLDLDMLSYINSGKSSVGFTASTWNDFQAKHPTCWITWSPLTSSSATPYGTGWRYKSSGGYTYIYRRARDVFGMD